MYDVIVIGGGASGLTVANVAKARGKSVLVIEANARVGKKILVAGNGKCNLSNENITVDRYNNDFVAKFLQNSYKVAEFFKSIGLVTKAIDGRIYPYSESGNTVLNLLRRNLVNEIKTEEKVEKIDFSDGIFTVNGYKGKKVAVCTGGITSGGMDGYDLLEKFGHKKTKLYPVLVPLKTDIKDIKALAGIRVKCELTLLIDGKETIKREGELLFKDTGISGIVSMEMSRYIKEGKSSVKVDFAPEYSLEEIKKLDKEGLLQKAVYNAVVKQAAARNISVEETIKGFIVKDVRLGDKSVAQVTRGGISTEEIGDTLESKLQKGLYVCGEVLDVDGDCGGYNLHWAFLSGIVAGENI